MTSLLPMWVAHRHKARIRIHLIRSASGLALADQDRTSCLCPLPLRRSGNATQAKSSRCSHNAFPFHHA